MKVNINKKDTRLHGLTRKLQTFSIIASLRILMNLRVRACNRVWLDKKRLVKKISKRLHTLLYTLLLLS